MRPPNFEKIISVVIPCRNEKNFIGPALDSLLAGDYPRERMEILVVDGQSDDGTREVLADYAKKYPLLKILDNPKKITPTAMNIGVRQARGDVIVRLDAHSIYPPDYIKKCVRYLDEYQAANVGGIRRAVPSRDTKIAKVIALTFSSFFGVGNAYYQTGTREPREVDTVFCGCYRKETFQKIGLYNENLVRSQDMEFNIRLKRAGGKIILVPDLIISYFPKSTLKEFFDHNVKDGLWAILPMKYGVRLKLRHFIPLFFVVGIIGPLIISIWYWPLIYLAIGIVILYLLMAIFFSSRIAVKEKKIILIPFLIAAFATRHFGYGIGSITGLIRLII